MFFAGKIESILKTFRRNGFLYIFGASIVNKLLAFVANILIVRFVDKDGFGLFSYANSWYTMAALLTGFGIIAGMMQFCSEDRAQEEKESIRQYCLTRGLLCDGVLVSVLVVAGLFSLTPVSGANSYVIALAPLLFGDLFFQYATVLLRSSLQNKKYAFLLNVQTILFLSGSLVGAYTAQIPGLIVGRYVSYVLVAIVIIIMFRGFGFAHPNPLRKALRSELWRYSIPTSLSSFLNMAIYSLDVVLVGIIVVDSRAIASYKVATQLPEGFMAIAGIIMICVFPHFVRHRYDRRWFYRKSLLVTASVFSLLALIAFVLIAFAPVIINLLWGERYLDAVVPFRILAFGLLVSSLQNVAANLLASLRKTSTNLVVSTASFILNMILVPSLTYWFGICGTAVATALTVLFSSVVSFFFFVRAVAKMPDVQESKRM